MKLLFTTSILAFTFLFNFGYAQSTELEKVHSVVKVFKTYEWYVNQHGLWEKELKRNKKNETAWVNYYTAARMAKIVSIDTADRNRWYREMDAIISKMEDAIPNTYEYYQLKSIQSSVWEATPTEFAEVSKWAEKAYAIDPERTEIYPDLMNVYMVQGNTEKMEEISKRWLASGEISPNLLAMTYNLLNSTEEGSILLTCCDNDTYPSLVLQYAAGIRKDITIINVYCSASNAAYRADLFKKANIPAANSGFDSHLDLINYVIKNKQDNPLYFAYADYINLADNLKDKVYNVGLALKYHEQEFNNTSVIINNFENKYLLDHLTFSLTPAQFPQEVKRQNLAYLPGLMILYNHYKTLEDTKKQNETKALILGIAAGTTHEEKLRQSFKDK